MPVSRHRNCCHLNAHKLNSICRVAGSAIALLALAACADLPPDYSPNFAQVPVVSPDRVVRYQLAPEACLVPDPTDTQLAPRLPPGCANNANLLAMAEKKRDVVRGRKLGAAPAAPSARAAQNYIYGTRGQLGASVGAPAPAVTPAAVTTEPAPAPAGRSRGISPTEEPAQTNH
jgi:hypothetical protein